MRMLTLSCLSLLSTGCSFMFVRPPPSEPDRLTYFDCVSSAAAPATDVTNAVVDGLLAASALDQNNPGFATGVGIAGAVYAASAIYGFVMTSKCDGAKEGLAARVHKAQKDLEVLLQSRAPAGSLPSGCRADVDCKGERICVNASCVEPPAAAPAPPSPAAAPPLRAAPPTPPPPAAPPLRAAPPAAPPPPTEPRPAPPPAPSGASLRP